MTTTGEDGTAAPEMIMDGKKGVERRRRDKSHGAGRGGGGREADLSHALSRLLRHQAVGAGIQLDKEGYAPLDRVLRWPPLQKISPTFAEVQYAVHSSDKQRFALKPVSGADATSTRPADWIIRANQGHSIALESEALLRPIILETDHLPLHSNKLPVPPTVVHGTYYAFWPAILASGGLKRMGRTHVHFSTGLTGGDVEVVSGMRRDAELLVYVDVDRCLREEPGIKWWLSENGVVLTEGDEEGRVPMRFFREVRGRNEEVGVLARDGVEVGQIPEGVRVVVPRGKGGRRGETRGKGGLGGK